MRILLAALFLLSSCVSVSTGGLYIPEGSHPHINFLAKATVGPAEALVAPTTQRGVSDLYTVGVYPRLGWDTFKFTLGAGWSWWRTWGTCYPPDYMQCDKSWTDGLTAGAGAVYESGHVRLDLRGQVFTEGPYDAALLFTAGYAF